MKSFNEIIKEDMDLPPSLQDRHPMGIGDLFNMIKKLEKRVEELEDIHVGEKIPTGKWQDDN
jgi:hypothetical protein